MHLSTRYTSVISDGDSKTIQHLNEVQPFGEDVTIVKHECVGHVQKRLGKRLRDVKKVSNHFSKLGKYDMSSIHIHCRVTF